MHRDPVVPEEVVSTVLREELGESLPIDIWYQGNIWVFRPFGRIDTGHAEDLDSALSEGIAQGMRFIVLDLTDTVYISSSGLRAVTKAAKKLKPEGGILSLCGMNEPVEEVFRVSGLIRLFPYYSTAEEAALEMEKLSEKKKKVYELNFSLCDDNFKGVGLTSFSCCSFVDCTERLGACGECLDDELFCSFLGNG